ncbi:MAG: hypothetical protein JWL77_2414 [Chthonomonadaceae bacterium]|nr:hypothetical protein [Chthonomonadaceae bacterium]
MTPYSTFCKDFAMLRSCVRSALFILCCCLALCCGVSRPGFCAPAPATWAWIWTADGAHPPETVFFRTQFRLTRAATSAKLLITADDNFRAYLNEAKKPVATGNDWTTVQEFDLTKQVRVGENLLAIETQNTGGAGGLLFKLILTLPGGRTQTLFSDPHVRYNRHPVPGWTLFNYDDKSWPFAKVVAPLGGGVWGSVHGALVADPSRLLRLWDIRAGGDTNVDPYTRPRAPGDRMILSTSASSLSDMQVLSSLGFTLFQTDSDHLSTEEVASGQWDWRTQDAARQAVQSLGLDWAYFPHYAFPPAWYRKAVPFTPIECLEHKQPVEAFSPWDPTWPTFITRGYDALARQFAPNPDPKVGKRGLSAVYVGVHGDFGEAGLLNGGRVSPAIPAQLEDWKRRFGNTHDHLGWWCNDPKARADFRAAMLQKYASLEALNTVWKRDFKKPEEITFPTAPRPEAKREWLDFVDWYQGSVGKAVDLNLSTARAHFPNSLLMLPCGFSDENPRGGNDNSLLPKLAAKYHAEVRSTHGGLYPFAGNAATMVGRLGSASRFYNVPFWTEGQINLTPEQETERIFEAVSQGAKGYFDWANNAVANRDVFYRYSKYMRVEKPIVDVAMFYPAEAQKLHPDQPYAPLFAQASAYVRDFANFDIVDDRMVTDGCLSRYRVLVLWEGTQADQATLDKIKEWVLNGGTLLCYDFGKVSNFDGGTPWYDKADLLGYIQELAPAKLTERYIGTVPAQYKIQVGDPQAANYLADGGEGWYPPEKEDDLTRRWTKEKAGLSLPVNPDRRYTLAVRATLPQEAAGLKHAVFINDTQVGEMNSAGDVTYHFLVPPDAFNGKSLATLRFQSETLHASMPIPGSTDAHPAVGLLVQSVQMLESGAQEGDGLPPPGTMRRELNIGLLNTSWARQAGKGLTIYFPATRKLLYGYFEVIRRVVYHLSSIDPAHRDALAVDDTDDGIYSTLFKDKILYYNSRNEKVVKTVKLSPNALAAWKGDITTPTENTWTLTLDPHSIGAVYFTAPPQELLYECEEFKDPGDLKPTPDPTCSPGAGPTCIIIPKGKSITTRISIDVAGQYTVFVRALRMGKLTPIDILIDDQPVPPVNAKAGQTLLAGLVTLTKGKHTLTLRPQAGQDARADFVLLTNDPTIGGYDFSSHAVPVE